MRPARDPTFVAATPSAPSPAAPAEPPREGTGLSLPPSPQTVEEVVRHMEEHLHNPAAQEDACRQLTRLISQSGGQDLVMERLGLEPIIRAMIGHPQEEGMQQEGCTIVRVLVRGREDIQTRMLKVGGTEAVLAAMRTHSSCMDIVVNGSVIVHQLSVSELGRQRIALRGGLRILTQVMKEHPSNLEVQEAGCSSFGNMAFDEELRDHFTSDSIQVVMLAMTRYPDEKELQDGAALFLHNLACDEHLAQVVKSMGGERLLEQALAKHPTSDPEGDEREAALELLRALG